ncbi:uncharacterized protein LOC101684417 [Mustela putorius furo]|uniref:Uncharacterized protein LOC101684417 n=1 Tax=Mustela putorius furo TaxID=9669 RepID=A0A8U0UQC1_MUSPF|nr:uncharacterized protein LOC101684417 [Mustela putorius furo]
MMHCPWRSWGVSRFPTLALVPPHAGRKLSEGPAGPRSTCGCVSALLPAPHPRRPQGLPQTTGVEGGRTLWRLVFGNQESALWFSTFLHRPLFGLPTALRAPAPPGPASGALLPPSSRRRPFWKVLSSCSASYVNKTFSKYLCAASSLKPPSVNTEACSVLSCPPSTESLILAHNGDGAISKRSTKSLGRRMCWLLRACPVPPQPTPPSWG